MIADRQRRCGA